MQINIKPEQYAKHPNSITLTTPITLIAGANGHGKSTLLTAIAKGITAQSQNPIQIEPTTSQRILKMDLDPKERSYYQKAPDAIIAEIDTHARHDYSHMLGIAMSSYHMSIDRYKYSEGQSRVIDLKRLFEIIDFIPNFDDSVPIYLLIDGVDSGLSPDMVIHLKELIFEASQKNRTNKLHIVMTTNTFEFLNDMPNATIIDAQTCQQIEPFNSYQDYVNYCQQTSTLDTSLDTKNVYTPFSLNNQ